MRKPVDPNLVPVIGKNIKTDMVMQEDDIRTAFNIGENEVCADLYAHYINCKHIIVEVGSKKDIEKAIRQLKNTMEKITNQEKPLHYASIVSDGIPKKASRLVKVRDNLMYYRRNGKMKPVEIENGNTVFHVYHFKKGDVKRDRERANRTLSLT